MPFGRDTLVIPNNIVLDGGTGLPQEGEIWGVRTPVKICIANCGRTITDSRMVTIDSLQELRKAVSNGTIADPVRLPLPPNNIFAAMSPSSSDATMRALCLQSNLKAFMELVRKNDVEKISVLMNKGFDPNFIDRTSGGSYLDHSLSSWSQALVPRARSVTTDLRRGDRFYFRISPQFI